MKKINKFIASIVVFVMILSTFSIFANADTSSPRRKMIVDHFDSLYGNPKISPNMDGSCAFVAMSMLLSYYDTYWNDEIVDKDLEWDKGMYYSATDYLESTFNANNEYSDWDSYTGGRNNFVSNNKDKYLQSYLIDLCNNLPIFDELGVFAYQTQDILQYYLYQDRSFDENQIKVHFYRAHNDDDKETMISLAQSLIYNGHPVIFSGLATDIFGNEIDGDDTMIGAHSMIGYDYDGTPGNYDIVLNLCWNNSYRQKIRSTDFQSVNSIIWLEIIEENLPHECSNNYYDPSTGEEFCACQIYYNTHPSHQSHIYHFEEFDSNTHFEECYCGVKTNVQAHDLTYSYYSATQHNKNCSECAYHEVVNHEYNIPHSPTNTYHSLKCACGVTSLETEAHYAHKYKNWDKSLHKVYCECGKEWTQPHVVESGSYSSGNKYALCLACKALVTIGMTYHQSITELPRSENGSFILPDGIIVLVDEDIEEYFNGTLEFIYPGDNSEAA